MDGRGFACVEGFLSDVELAWAKAFVASAINKAGGTYVGFVGKSAVAGSGLDRLAEDAGFQSIFTRLYRHAVKRPPPPIEFYQLLRCLTGTAAADHSLNFHYDSYVITGLIPIEIPTEGQTGDFLMVPNTRPIRTSYAANLADKMLVDNRLSQLVLRRLRLRAQGPVTRIKMVPGNLYFFWGYRSIHTNEPCDPDKVRATAVFHYANPHAGSGLRSRLGR
ncbi:hypothetical protein GCM10011390_14120 [Aureimonas endophytica]|uniref:Uncharacterized protein n=1 Tax=Aureimonas endophytica TaxID=2027858 RepID=A0A916ZGK0_9HYPH|nr:hypothetical protein [Aureimonas endophytica]GGD96495.1 hypothetical protein GCM10011390_14120 [Aureimonas endophytica]